MRKSFLTIAFDDGYLDTYKYAVSYLDKMGLKCTFAVPVGLIGKKCEKRPVVNWRNIVKMSRQGHDIASHTLTHVNFLTQFKAMGLKKTEEEIALAGKTLKKRLKKNPDSFVYPYLDRLPNEKVQNIVKRHYLSSRISKEYPAVNALPLKSRYSAKGFLVTEAFSAEKLKHFVRSASKPGKWTIEVFHLVGKKNTKSAHRNKPYRFFMHIDDFKRHIDYVLSLGITVLTQKEMIKRY